MGCNDICVVMDYDGANEFYTEAVRRARKSYRCCECGDSITVGDSHHYAAGKSDGHFWEYRTCASCEEIRKEFSCGSWIFGELWASVDDQLFPEWNEMTAIDCLAKLTTDRAIEKMRAQYQRYRDDRA